MKSIKAVVEGVKTLKKEVVDWSEGGKFPECFGNFFNKVKETAEKAKDQVLKWDGDLRACADRIKRDVKNKIKDKGHVRKFFYCAGPHNYAECWYRHII